MKHTIAGILAIGIAITAHADWPERPVRIVVPSAVGTSSDISMRLIAEKLAPRLGQPVIVDNKPGASGIIGSDFGAKQAPDGYTLTMGAAGPLIINRWIRTEPLPFDLEKDFVPVAAVAWAPQMLVARKDLPISNFRELLEYSKRPEVRLSYGTQGNGSTSHLVIAQVQSQTGLKAEHIPYNGPKSLVDLIGGQIDFLSETIPVVLGAVNAGQVKVIGVSSAERVAYLPGFPTLREQGVENFDLQGWITMLAPAKTPEPILRRLSQEIDAVMKLSDVQKRMNELGLPAMEMPREKMVAFLQSESRKWREVVRISGAAASVK
jgi:tripartite-type tricarboxylate transporter receptor subunit TctC